MGDIDAENSAARMQVTTGVLSYTQTALLEVCLAGLFSNDDDLWL